jgi:hypothetical protein
MVTIIGCIVPGFGAEHDLKGGSSPSLTRFCETLLPFRGVAGVLWSQEPNPSAPFVVRHMQLYEDIFIIP